MQLYIRYWVMRNKEVGSRDAEVGKERRWEGEKVRRWEVGNRYLGFGIWDLGFGILGILPFY